MVKVFIVHLLKVVLNLGSVDVSVKTEEFLHPPGDHPLRKGQPRT
jgi:hypothetical protein